MPDTELNNLIAYQLMDTVLQAVLNFTDADRSCVLLYAAQDYFLGKEMRLATTTPTMCAFVARWLQ